MYSHRYLENEANNSFSGKQAPDGKACAFFQNIYIKTNIAEALEKQLSAKNWKKEVINIGSVCDSYQPVEAKYGLMRKVLTLMIKYRNPVTISTKSDLILRDFDLLTELTEITHVNLAVTVTTMDKSLSALLYLKEDTRKHFFDFLDLNFPKLVDPYCKLYAKGGVDRAYKAELYSVLSSLMQKYNLSGDYMKFIKAESPCLKQLKLTDFSDNAF